MRFPRISLSLCLVLALVVVGCGSSKSSNPVPAKSSPIAAATPEPAKKEIVEVKVASGDKGSLLYLPLLVAEQLGYFEAEGIKLAVTEFKGGAQVAQALIAGEADFGSTVTDHAPKYKAQGVDVSVVALYTRLPGSSLLVDSRHAETIKSIKDLKGKKVGVTTVGSGSHQGLLAMLEKEGLTAKDVEIISVGFDLGKAFVENKVVAGVTYDPYVTIVTETKAGKVLGYDLRTEKDTRALYGTEYPFGALLTRGDMIQNKPEVVQGMVRSIVKANRWIASHSAQEIAAKIPAQYKSDEATYMKAMENSKAMMSPDGIVSTVGMDTVIKVLKTMKVVPDSANVSGADVINMKFAQQS